MGLRSWWNGLFAPRQVQQPDWALDHATLEAQLTDLGIPAPGEVHVGWDPKVILRALRLVRDHQQGLLLRPNDLPKQRYGLDWMELHMCVRVGLLSVVPMGSAVKFVPTWSAVGVARAADQAGLLSDASAGVLRA